MWFPWPSINLSQSLGGRFSLLFFFSHFLDEVLLGESFPWVSWAPTCLSGYAIQTISQDWVYNEQPWGINVHVSPGQSTGLFTACYKSKGFTKFSVPQLWSKPIASVPMVSTCGVWGQRKCLQTCWCFVSGVSCLLPMFMRQKQLIHL